MRHGDDGLLEYLLGEGQARAADSRWAGVRDLADALLNRRLFKPVARMSDRSHAKRLWERYGTDPDERRQAEQIAARFAGIKPAWQAVMSIPPERMRLKPALVLVDDEELIDTMLHREDSPRGDGRGDDIYAEHRKLWGLEIFVHPSVRRDHLRRNALLAAFAEQLHISRWDDHDASVLPAMVARRQAGEELELTTAQEETLEELLPSFYDGSVGLAERPTLAEMVSELKLAWDAHQGPKPSEEAPGEQPPPATASETSAGEEAPPVDADSDEHPGQQPLS